MKKRIKIVLIALFVICITFTNVAFASSMNVLTDEGIGTDLNEYNKGLNDVNFSRTTDMAGTVLGVIQAVGMAASIIVLMIIGIRFMMGSVEEKAEYKKALLPYIIGVGLLFSGTVMPKLVYDIVKQIV